MTSSHRQRIVVIEDDEALSRLLRALLEMNGYEVHAETRGEAALRYLRENPVELVILDLRLPDMDGYEVCKRLRHFFHPWDLPVLMLTGMDRPMDQLRGFAFGADAYLTKPCDPPEILKTVALLLGETALQGEST